MRRIVWTIPARNDVSAIFDWLLERDLEAALQVLRIFQSAPERLLVLPALGRPGRVIGTRELVVNPYVIAYRVAGETVEILRVIN